MIDLFAAPGAWPLATLPLELRAPPGSSTLRLASAGYLSAADDSPASTLYEPRILGDIEISASALDAAGLGGRVALAGTEVLLHDGDGWAADMARYGTADGSGLRVRSVAAVSPRASNFGTPLQDAVTVFQGLVANLRLGEERRAVLALADLSERLNVNLQANLYGGTGGQDGAPELKGLPKPVSFGERYNVAPVALGQVDLGAGVLPTYQTHWRGIQGHTAVRVRGAPQAVTTGAPGVGEYRDWPALGCFQLGASPDGEVRCDVRGDASPSYANTTGTILQRMLRTLGPQLTMDDFDMGMFALAEVDLPGVIGWGCGATPVTAVSAAEDILRACGGVLSGGRDGRLRLWDPLAQDLPQWRLTTPDVVSLIPVPMPASLRPAPQTAQSSWQKNWAPSGDLVGSVDDDTRTLLSGTESMVTINSAALSARAAQSRQINLGGLYAQEAGATGRAQRLLDWLAQGPQCFEVVTDAYPAAIDLGQIGAVEYPLYGLAGGFVGVVVGWRESAATGRVTMTLAGV
jgi:hypothetical protein